ncbi:MAG: glycosyltransferase family 4 protein, partial [Gammaproteobacteria bacterium]|nr:glycosyltransferase family 4 protein [Gammaproteobacteria bacterium]
MDKKKNILVLSDFPPTLGGPYIWYYRICELLFKKGYEIFTFGGKGIPPEEVHNIIPSIKKGVLFKGVSYAKDLILGLLKQGTVIAELVFFGIIIPRDFKQIISFIVLINRVIDKLPEGPSVVLAAHANMNGLLGYLLCKRNKYYKLVIRCHGGGILEFAESRPKLVSFLLRNADYLNCVSQYIVDECVKKGADPEKTKVIVSARDIPEMEVSVEKEDIVLFAGFLEPRKDPMVFIKAIKEICEMLKSRRQYSFVIVGSGSLKKKMQDYCKANGIEEAVVFTGVLSLQRTWDWMKKSKILVLPSIREPSGAVLTEGMAYRCYCIAASAGGIPEIVTPDRGSIFEPGDYMALAKLIDDFFKQEDVYVQRISNAYNHVKTNYSF